MAINTAACGLSPTEEAFIQALLWEEGHLQKGPATLAAEARGLSLLRCLEPANRLSSNLSGVALNHLRDSDHVAANWPWGDLTGEDVLRLLWSRLTDKSSAGKQNGTANPVTAGSE